MSELPNGVDKIIDLIAEDTKQNQGFLDSRVLALFKADQMNCTRRWAVIDPLDFQRACYKAGMSARAVAQLTDCLKRRKQGRNLILTAGYSDEKYSFQVTVFPEHKPVVSSPIW